MKKTYFSGSKRIQNKYDNIKQYNKGLLEE